jgi:hypothetical protein
MIASKDQPETIAAAAAGSVEQELNLFPPALDRLAAVFVIAAAQFLRRCDGRGQRHVQRLQGCGQNSSADGAGMPSRGKSGFVALRVLGKTVRTPAFEMD